jgi:hypothetical protein
VTAQTRPISAKARATFLAELASSCNVTASAAKVGHDRATFYRLRDRDAVFAGEWRDAIEEAVDRLEAAAFRYATVGAEERTYDADGNLVSRRIREDPATAARLLAAHRPALYSERHRLEIGGSVDVEHTLAAGRPSASATSSGCTRRASSRSAPT